MDLKFYLNKIIKIDNIEGYTLKSLKELKNSYDRFLNSSKGIDPDYPMLSFGNGKEKVFDLTKKVGDDELMNLQNNDLWP